MDNESTHDINFKLSRLILCVMDNNQAHHQKKKRKRKTGEIDIR